MGKQAGRPRTVSNRASWSINGLGAERPFPEFKENLELFCQFVGDWVIVEARMLRTHGVEFKLRGEVHFGWILDGRAVQDVWMTYDEVTDRTIPVGTTVRFYDPKIDAWHSIWISPMQGVVQTFTARKIEEGIVLESKTKEGHPEKWIFSEITKNSFRWHAEESHDNGRTWMLTEEMRIRRKQETRSFESSD